MNNSPRFSRTCLFIVGLLVCGALAAVGLTGRLKAENTHRDVAFVMDYRDIASLSRASDTTDDELIATLRGQGVGALLISEFTGKELIAGVMPLRFGPMSSLAPERALGGQGAFAPDQGALLIPNDAPHKNEILEYLRTKIPQTAFIVLSGQTLAILPQTADELTLYEGGLLPDLAAIDFATRHKIPYIFRPAPCVGVGGDRTSKGLEWLHSHYPDMVAVLPAGTFVAGYPDVAGVAKTLKQLEIPLAQVEFVKQIGVTELAQRMKPWILPLHSLVRDEVIARRMTRNQIVERMVRAVHERSIRLLLLRPYDMYSGDRLKYFLEDAQTLHQKLADYGYRFAWPQIIRPWGRSPASAIACALALVLCAWHFAARLRGSERETAKPLEIAALALTAGVFSLALFKVPAAARLAGGFLAAFAALEASLLALETPPRSWDVFKRLVGAFAIVLCAGLSIASFYGTLEGMLRLTPFSGVRMTLLLPLLLLLVHDFKRRIHPESAAQLLGRPSYWGEIVLCGVCLLAMALLAIRSDNVSFVPEWEIRFRDFLERILVVRPRTKEFLVGYPCLVLYGLFVRRGWAPGTREVLRVAACIAYSSAINSFCHLHTPLELTIIRTVNGFWVGILLGIALALAIDKLGVPLWRNRLGSLFK